MGKDPEWGLWNSSLSYPSFPKCSLGKLKKNAEEQEPGIPMAFGSLFWVRPLSVYGRPIKWSSEIFLK